MQEGSELSAMRLVRTPALARLSVAALAVLSPALVLVLLVVPWQQAAVGAGQVIAYAPAERQQRIDATVSGRLAEWHVVEGQRVDAGDALVSLSDNDPALLGRLGAQRDALADELSAAERAIDSYEARLRAEQAALELAMAENDAGIRARERKRLGQAAALEAAVLHEDRVTTLHGEGILGQRELELSQASARQSGANIDAWDEEISAARRARDGAVRRAEAKIASINADLEGARSKAAASLRQLSAFDVTISRQQAQVIRAPRAGIVLGLLGGEGGQQVKAGERLLTLVPEARSSAVELWVDGNDMPLIQAGDSARLLFEGWPALQVVGLPGAAAGTFGGEVAFVDAAGDGVGKFRVVILPDTDDAPWPDSAVLRQGVRAKGWVLLQRVPLWYELWRRVNGFPALPTIDKGDPATLPSQKKPRAPGALK